MPEFNDSVPNQLGSNRSDTSMQKDLGSGAGGIYQGTIVSYLKANEYFKVVLTDEGFQVTHINCVWAAGFFSGMLGFDVNFAPNIGTEVTIFYPGGGIGYIIGSQPESSYLDVDGMARRITTGGKREQSNTTWQQQEHFYNLRQKWQQGEHEDVNANSFSGSKPAADLVEGEFDITNSMGVGLQLMRHFGILKGSDLAKVEASIIDDMVRIVSHTFRHFSSFGDYKIYNDSGRLNVVWDGTTNDWEAFGKDEPNEERATLDGQDAIAIDTDKFANLAKWRFSSYIGFLGDFINLFVTDKLSVKKPEEHLNRSGKGRVHVNEDGSVLVQSVSDIAFERVCRIPVPLQLKAEHDPEGDGEFTNMELPFPSDDAPIKCWDWNKSGGVDKSFWCVYQLRDYGRWFSNYYTKARFHQLKEDWKVKSEAETDEPRRKDSDEIDKREANLDIPETYMDVYSSMRIYRDGSISVNDAYENSIVLSESGVNISSATNLQLEAAGSVNVVAGRDFNVIARNSVDLNALKGGMSLRSETFLQQYCHKGGILIETDTEMGPTIWDKDNMDQPDVGQLDPSRVGGILLWSRNSSMRLLSKYDMGLRSDQGFQFFRGAVQMWDSEAPMLLKNQLLLTGDVAACKGLFWTDESIIEQLYIGNDYKSVFEHPGHIIGDNDRNLIHGPMEDLFDDKFEKYMDGFIARNYDGKFQHRTDQEYGTENFADPKAPAAMYESVTQQGLRLNAQNFTIGSEYQYGEFNVTSDVKLEDRGYAWPGTEKQHWHMPNTVNGEDLLWAPTTKTEFTNNGTPLTLTDIKLKQLL